ncbi:hypothetical protein [Nocardioides sp. OK12]|uniref:hypothetical protein n=1 Tax=Nocardioides sp. OK12 TaxID=2758661 RepID=UPI0021C287FE|nr:hypothetical protein [Nocardioides sp. OK12]
MDFLTAVLPGLLSGLVGSYAGYRLSGRASRAAETRSIGREAAADLCAPLRDLRSMSRRWGRVELAQGEVGSAVIAWSEAFDRQGHRLPTDWRHVGQSVRAAVGEVFGGVAVADIRPEMAAYPLADPDFKWQDFADDYLTYVLDAVVRWGDGDRSARKLRNFDSWLAITGRHTRYPA